MQKYNIVYAFFRQTRGERIPYINQSSDKVHTNVTEVGDTGDTGDTECLHPSTYMSQAWILSGLTALFKTKRFFHVARSSITRVITFVTDVCSPQKTSPFRASRRHHKSINNTEGQSLMSRLPGGRRAQTSSSEVSHCIQPQHRPKRGNRGASEKNR